MFKNVKIIQKMKKNKFFNAIIFCCVLAGFIFGIIYYCLAGPWPGQLTTEESITHSVPLIGKYIFEVSIPGLAKKGDIVFFTKDTNPFLYIVVNFIQWGLKLSGVILFIVIVYSGVMYSLSGGDPKKKQEAQTRIIEALIGFFLLFGFYVILNTINPNILKQGTTASPVIVSPNVETNPEYAENPAPPTSTEPPTPGNYINIKNLRLPLTPELQSYPAVYLDSELATKLALLKGGSFIITDACIKLNSDGTCETTISRNSNDCHRYGLCADIDNQGSTTLEALRNNAMQEGLAVLDEGTHLHVTLPGVTYPTYYGGVDYSDCKSGSYQWYVAGRCPK